MRDDFPNAAPNYKNACVVMFGINIAWIFTVIWAIWGLIFVMLAGWLTNWAITFVSQWAEERAARERAHPRAKIRGSFRH